MMRAASEVEPGKDEGGQIPGIFYWTLFVVVNIKQ